MIMINVVWISRVYIHTSGLRRRALSKIMFFEMVANAVLILIYTEKAKDFAPIMTICVFAISHVMLFVCMCV